MGKKIGKAIILFLAAAFLAGALWLGNGFFGNPVSAVLARRGLNRYVKETYGHMDLRTERFGYNFKTVGYFAYLTSETSRDTAFYIYMDMLGHVIHDSFDTWVTGKQNTEQRVQEQYRELVGCILDAADFPYESDIKGGELEFQQDWEWGDDRDHSYAIPREELVPDKEYSRQEILDFGRRAGTLTIYVMENTVTPERAAEIMLDIKGMFDEAEVPFYRMDFVLRYPKPEDGSPWPDEDVRAELIYEDIRAEGLTERIETSHDVIYGRFAEMDAEKESIVSDKN